MKKVMPLLLVVLGIALLLGALVVWLEPPKEGGVLAVTGGILSFLLGAGASIKGWRDLFKKDSPATPKIGNQRRQEVIDSPDAEQAMRGKGGRMTQKSTKSPRSKQTME